MCQWIGEEVKDGADTPRTETREESEKKENEINNGNTGDGNNSSGNHSVEKEHSDDGKQPWREVISERLSNISKDDIKQGKDFIVGKISALFSSGMSTLKSVFNAETMSKLNNFRINLVENTFPQFLSGITSSFEIFKDTFFGGVETAKYDTDSKSDDKDTKTDNDDDKSRTPYSSDSGLNAEQRIALAEFREAIREYPQYSATLIEKGEDFLKLPEAYRGTFESVGSIYQSYNEGRISYEEYKDKLDRTTAQLSLIEVAGTAALDVAKYEKTMEKAVDEGMATKNADGSYTIEKDLKTGSRYDSLEAGTVLPSAEDFKEERTAIISYAYECFIKGEIEPDRAKDLCDDISVGDIKESGELGEYDKNGYFRWYSDMKEEYLNKNSDFHKDAGEPFLTDSLSLASVVATISYNTEEAIERREAILNK